VSVQQCAVLVEACFFTFAQTKSNMVRKVSSAELLSAGRIFRYDLVEVSQPICLHATECIRHCRKVWVIRSNGPSGKDERQASATLPFLAKVEHVKRCVRSVLFAKIDRLIPNDELRVSGLSHLWVNAMKFSEDESKQIY